MVCKVCGGKLDDNEKFCRYCGSTVIPEEPKTPVFQAPPAAPEVPKAPQAPVFQPAPEAPKAPEAPQPPQAPVFQPLQEEAKPEAPVFQAPLFQAPKAPETPSYPKTESAYAAYKPAAPQEAKPEAPVFQPPQAPLFQAPKAPETPSYPKTESAYAAYKPVTPPAPKGGEATGFQPGKVPFIIPAQAAASQAPKKPEAPAFQPPQAPAQQMNQPGYSRPDQGAAPYQSGQSSTAPFSKPGYQGAQAPGQDVKQPPQPAKAQKAPKYAKPPKTPGNGGKKPSKGLLIGLAAGALALVVVLVVAVLLTSSPVSKVSKGFAGTYKEFSKAGERMNLSASSELLKAEELSVDMDLKVNAAAPYTWSFLNRAAGIGVQMEMDISLPQRSLGAKIAPYYGSMELMELSAAVDDDTLYFDLPGLLPDAYGVNTETALADLERMGADLNGMSQVGFNFFDLVEMVREEQQDNQIDMEAITAATAQLVKELEVEKNGSGEKNINGNRIKTKDYTVTIPQDSAEAWLEAMEDALPAGINMKRLVTKMLESMNLPSDLVEEVLYELDLADYSDAPVDFAPVYELLDETGDIELEVSLTKGKVAEVYFKDKLYGTKVEISLQLGGGDEYVDDISLKIDIDGEALEIESSGMHNAKDGLFQDKTVISFDGEKRITLSTEYDLELEEDNLTITAELADAYTLKLEGTLMTQEELLELNLEKIRITFAGEKEPVFDLSFQYRVMPYQQRNPISGAQLLSDMDKNDLLEALVQTEANLESWLQGLVNKLPALDDLM